MILSARTLSLLALIGKSFRSDSRKVLFPVLDLSLVIRRRDSRKKDWEIMGLNFTLGFKDIAQQWNFCLVRGPGLDLWQANGGAGPKRVCGVRGLHVADTTLGSP